MICRYIIMSRDYPSRRPSQSLDCKVYVGDLDPRASEREVEEPFSKIGPLKYVYFISRVHATR